MRGGVDASQGMHGPHDSMMAQGKETTGSDRKGHKGARDGAPAYHILHGICGILVQFLVRLHTKVLTVPPLACDVPNDMQNV